MNLSTRTILGVAAISFVAIKVASWLSVSLILALFGEQATGIVADKGHCWSSYSRSYTQTYCEMTIETPFQTFQIGDREQGIGSDVNIVYLPWNPDVIVMADLGRSRLRFLFREAEPFAVIGALLVIYLIWIYTRPFQSRSGQPPEAAADIATPDSDDEPSLGFKILDRFIKVAFGPSVAYIGVIFLGFATLLANVNGVLAGITAFFGVSFLIRAFMSMTSPSDEHDDEDGQDKNR